MESEDVGTGRRSEKGSGGLGGKKGAGDREEMKKELDTALRKRDDRIRKEMREWVKVVEEREGGTNISPTFLISPFSFFYPFSFIIFIFSSISILSDYKSFPCDYFL